VQQGWVKKGEETIVLDVLGEVVLLTRALPAVSLASE